MGVPKFFRWISERYPKINQPIHAPPNPDTQAAYFPSYKELNDANKDANSKSKLQQDNKVYIQKNSIIPEFDRLYLDMNGIIHCSSHNNASDDNATVDPDTHIESNGPGDAVKKSVQQGSVQITEAEIFRNVCYYVDRVVSDIAQPKELVYMAIDGVAPRAKMNQQRSRRYRSGKEKEIENTFYGAHLLAKKKQEELLEKHKFESGVQGDEYWDIQGVGMTDTPSINMSTDKPSFSVNDDKSTSLEEVEPGRYTGTFETSKDKSSSLAVNGEDTPFDLEYEEFLEYLKKNNDFNEESMSSTFHSNEITPGTPFFERCTQHLEHFIKRKLHSDPRWKDLTIIFSGPKVPGEGEHKIMDFIRRQKTREDYNPNTRHCMFGQDGDLIMLGLATHEPHFALLREEVVFDQSRKREQQKLAELKAKSQKEKMEKLKSKMGEESALEIEGASDKVSASIDSYIHNSNFELLHMPILRDYLAYEFETREVLPNSPFELEKTIDDFVFMTFIVGNDFLVSYSPMLLKSFLHFD